MRNRFCFLTVLVVLFGLASMNHAAYWTMYPTMTNDTCWQNKGIYHELGAATGEARYSILGIPACTTLVRYLKILDGMYVGSVEIDTLGFTCGSIYDSVGQHEICWGLRIYADEHLGIGARQGVFLDTTSGAFYPHNWIAFAKNNQFGSDSSRTGFVWYNVSRFSTNWVDSLFYDSTTTGLNWTSWMRVWDSLLVGLSTTKIFPDSISTDAIYATTYWNLPDRVPYSDSSGKSDSSVFSAQAWNSYKADTADTVLKKVADAAHSDSAEYALAYKNDSAWADSAGWCSSNIIRVAAFDSREKYSADFICPEFRSDSVLRIAFDSLRTYPFGTLYCYGGHYNLGWTAPGCFGVENGDSGYVIEGEGKGVTVFTYMDDITNVWGAYIFSTIESGADHITWRDFTVDCNGPGNHYAYTQGWTSNGTYITWDNIEILNCYASGAPPEAIMLQKNSDNIVLNNVNTPLAEQNWFEGASNITITDCPDLSYLYMDSCTDVKIDNSGFYKGMWLRYGTNKNIQISNSSVSGTRRFEAENTNNLQLSNVKGRSIDFNGDTTVTMTGSQFDTVLIAHLSGATISGNKIGYFLEYHDEHIFEKSTISGNTMGDGGFIGDSLTITGNTFYGSVALGGYANAFTGNTIKYDCSLFLRGNSNDLDVLDNIIERGNDGFGYSIRIANNGFGVIFNDILLQGNHIHAVNEWGISCDSGVVITRLNIIGNILDSCAINAGASGIGFNLYGVTGGVIKNNIIKAITTGIKIHTDCSGLVLWDNKITATTKITDWGTGTRRWGVNDDSAIVEYDKVGIGKTPTEKLDVNGNIKGIEGVFDSVSAGQSIWDIDASDILKLGMDDSSTIDGSYVKATATDTGSFKISLNSKKLGKSQTLDSLMIYICATTDDSLAKAYLDTLSACGVSYPVDSMVTITAAIGWKKLFSAYNVPAYKTHQVRLITKGTGSVIFTKFGFYIQ